jgi:hypothetical protein
MISEELSEYITKIPNAISAQSCQKLLVGIDEAMLEELVSIQGQSYELYSSTKLISQIFKDHDGGSFSYEFDTIHMEKSNEGFFNLGSSSHSKRFLTFMFIINEQLSNTTLEFPLQNITNKCSVSDVYIIPSNFSHRYKVKLSEGDVFSAACLHLCFVVN